MDNNQTKEIEKHLDSIVKNSVCFQCIAIIIVVLMISFKFPYYKELGGTFSMTALIASFILSRIYINAGKKLEEIKKFSSEEGKFRKNEYFFKFFFPYVIWLSFLFLFYKVL